MTTAIAVLTYNQPQLVVDLDLVLGPYLIIVDNGSTERIIGADIRVPDSHTFSTGWNYAMKQIDADWVAMLNDDITGITREMIDNLVDEAEKNNFDVISPVMNCAHLHMQDKGIGLREVPHLDWVAPIIRKSAWDAVGGFNEAWPGWGCDLDIAYRLRSVGYRMAVHDAYSIHHLGGKATFDAGTQDVHSNVSKMNETFRELYGVQDWNEFFSKYLDVKYEFTKTPEGMQWISMDDEMQLLPKGS